MRYHIGSWIDVSHELAQLFLVTSPDRDLCTQIAKQSAARSINVHTVSYRLHRSKSVWMSSLVAKITHSFVRCKSFALLWNVVTIGACTLTQAREAMCYESVENVYMVG